LIYFDQNSKVLIWVSKTKAGHNLFQKSLCWFDFKIQRLWSSSLQELRNKRFKTMFSKKNMLQRLFLISSENSPLPLAWDIKLSPGT
jgi:hypothetical protein